MADQETKWEYRVLTVGSFWSGIKDEEFEEILNEMGEDGWEVVGFRSLESSNKASIVAKRPLSLTTRRRRNMPTY
jgi:hypothetical protein